jgi:hypothetical protein
VQIPPSAPTNGFLSIQHGQGVAETMGVGSKDLCSAEDGGQHSLGNPA